LTSELAHASAISRGIHAVMLLQLTACPQGI